MIEHAPRKLDIACGQRKQEGFTGIDLDGDADIVHDLFSFPWPIKAGSVREVAISHFVEHIPHRLDGYPQDGWFVFWDEVHRITRKGGIVRVVHPYGKSDRALWDPSHTRSIVETTWLYLDKNWRESQMLDHYATTADFEVVTIAAMGLADDFMTRSEEAKAFAQQHYWNVYPDLSVELRKR